MKESKQPNSAVASTMEKDQPGKDIPSLRKRKDLSNSTIKEEVERLAEPDNIEPKKKRARIGGKHKATLSTGETLIDLTEQGDSVEPRAKRARSAKAEKKLSAGSGNGLQVVQEYQTVQNPINAPGKKRARAAEKGLETIDDEAEEDLEPQPKRIRVATPANMNDPIVGYHEEAPALTISARKTDTGNIEFIPTLSREYQSRDILLRWKKLVPLTGLIQPSKVVLNEEVLDGVEAEPRDSKKAVWQKRKLTHKYLNTRANTRGVPPANAYLDAPQNQLNGNAGNVGNAGYAGYAMPVQPPLEDIDFATAIMNNEETGKALRRVARSVRYGQEESPSTVGTLRETIKGLKERIREFEKTVSHQANKIRTHEQKELMREREDAGVADRYALTLQNSKYRKTIKELEAKVAEYEKVPPLNHAMREQLEKRTQELADSDEKIADLERKLSHFENLHADSNDAQAGGNDGEVGSNSGQADSSGEQASSNDAQD